MGSLFEFVRRLIDIPSLTGREGELARYLAGRLREQGFRPKLQEVGDGRFNVYVRSEASPRVALCTHLDTVPPFFDSWEDERYIYGRGACDAKGILATMTAAAERLRRERVEGWALLFVVGEEVDSIGAKTANQFGGGSDYVVVGEPTDNILARGHKGSFQFMLKARGRAAHSAYPHLGDSAIDHLLGALDRIRGTDWGRDDVLGEATVNIGTIEGGVAANVVAPAAAAGVYIRVVGKVCDVETKLGRILDGDPNLSYEVVAQNDAVYCEVLPGFHAAPVAFGTDIPSLKSFGRPLLIGPGSIHDAHTDREKVGKADLLDAVELYRRITKILLGVI